MNKFAVIGTVLVAGAVAAGGAYYYTQGGSQMRILFVDSYHEGYEWSDGITEGIRDVFEGENVELRIHRMDTKNNTEEDFKVRAGLQVRDLIDSYRPDLVIATDDNAQKYAIAPFYRNTDLPVVFAGVNWDASVYGYPADNITGMIEVQSVREVLALLGQFTDGQRIGVLAGDTASYREKESKNHEEVLGLHFDDERIVSTFEEWKQAFVDMQSTVDMLYVFNNAGIEGWDNQEAARFAMQNTRIPTGGTNPWIAPYVLVTFTKDATEQGEHAARTALRILNGESPRNIPLVTNRRGEVLVNSELAHRLRIDITPELLDAASNNRLY